MLKVSRKRGSRPIRRLDPVPRGRAKKVSLTVDEGVLRAMQVEAKRSKRTLSAEVTEALARELRRRRLQELIAEYEAKEGPISSEELAAVQAEWQD
jgi:hypothetical protein